MADSPIWRLRLVSQLLPHTSGLLKDLKPCIHRGVTTPQGQQLVWYAQQS